MAKREPSSEIGESLIRLAWLGAVVAVVVFGFYFANFGIGKPFSPSGDPGDWGVFGDYIGGLLNPFFSFLAFLGVLITILLQARQLDIVRAHAEFEEVQRVLAALSARVDMLLSSTPVGRDRSVVAPAIAGKSLFEIISAMGTSALTRPESADVDWLKWAMADQYLATIKEALRSELTAVSLELEALAWMLGRYQNEGGSQTVVDFYNYRYRAIVVWLDVAGVVASHSQIQSVFRPAESRSLFAKE